MVEFYVKVCMFWVCKRVSAYLYLHLTWNGTYDSCNHTTDHTIMYLLTFLVSSVEKFSTFLDEYIIHKNFNYGIHDDGMVVIFTTHHRQM